MKVLSIGTDRKLFDTNSAVRERARRYGDATEETHIIVFSLAGQHYTTEKISDKVTVHATNSFSRWLYVFDAIRIGTKILSEKKFISGKDVITCQDPFESGFVGFRLSKKFHLPFQLQIHTDFLSPYFKTSLLQRLRVSLAGFLVSRAHGLRTVSSVISSSIVKKYKHLKSRPDILPIFIDVEKISKNTSQLEKLFPQFSYIIFMASRLESEKKIDVALYSFKKVVTVFPQAGLVISGDGSERKRLEHLALSLGLSANVIFLGWQENIYSYYSISNVFLLTSEYEGYAMTLIEAMSSGCPIVTTNVGIAKTDIFKDGQNAFVCAVGDKDCLARRIIELLSHEDKRELFKREMEKTIAEMSLSESEYISQYIGLLEKITKEYD